MTFFELVYELSEEDYIVVIKLFMKRNDMVQDKLLLMHNEDTEVARNAYKKLTKEIAEIDKEIKKYVKYDTRSK